MKVLLVNPPAVHEIKGPHPLKADDMGVFPHLGLMYIAAMLQQNKEFEVKLLDMALEKTDEKDLADLIKDFQPQVVGFSSYTDCLYDLKVLVDAVRKEASRIVICIGGPHVEAYPNETLNTFPVDCVIRGDGEYSFRELCRRVRDNKSWKDVRGVGYKDLENTVLNEPWQVENLDEPPFPPRHLSSMERVKSAVARGAGITSICSSRGCPFPCTFCNSPYKQYRLRSAQNVVAEIKQCYEEFGINEFFFFDDLFNLNKQRLSEMCEAIKSLPFKIIWSFRGRINFLDEEVLRSCKEAGCNRIHFGVESGTERVLKIFKKGVELQDIRNVFELCHKVGIETVGNFIIGAPTETREEMDATFRFAYSLNPTFVEFHVLVPYPYTEIYKNMLSSGLLKEDVWKKFALNPQPEFNPPLCEDNLSSEEMYKLLNEAYRKFYFRPAYVFKQVFKLVSFKDFCFKLKGAYRLLMVTKDKDKRTGR
ncbi:MAG: radical SAM protein [Proteobacteria bacterium]|nr:radical SAM protein [Pseudomonadota bacterium]